MSRDSGNLSAASQSDVDTFAAAAREIEADLPGARGKTACDFLEALRARAPKSKFWRRPPALIAAHVVSLFEFLDGPLDDVRVRMRAAPGSDGHERAYLESVCPDQPFIVDSLRELIRVRGYQVEGLLHPIVAVTRDAEGRIATLGVSPEGGELVSVVSLEIAGGVPEDAREALARDAHDVVEEARGVVRDFEAIVARLRQAADELGERCQAATGAEKDELDEALAFLSWLEHSNYVFLGCRTYRFKGSGDDITMQMVPRSGLGLLRPESRSSFRMPRSLAKLPARLQELLRDPRTPLIIQKTKAESPVLRRTRMDSIGVKRFDTQGRLVGEYRFLGLFTAKAHNDLPSDIPILREKLDRIVEIGQVVHGSHDHNRIFSIFTSMPKSELFATDADELAERVLSLLATSEERDARVFYRPFLLESGVSVMVLLPRERLSADLRQSIQDLLVREFQGTFVDFHLALTDEPLARLHFYIETAASPPPSPPVERLEAQVQELARTWEDHLRDALVAAGEDRPHELAQRYATAFPVSYTAARDAREALDDARNVERVLHAGGVHASVYRTVNHGQHGYSTLKIFSPAEPLGLSRLMPILSHLGLEVLDEETFAIRPDVARMKRETTASHRLVFLHSFRVVVAGTGPIADGVASAHVGETIAKVLAGDTEDDPMNALVSLTGMTWRQVSVLRAYYAYLRQLGAPLRQRTTYTTLLENHGVSQLLVELFETRFDPNLGADARVQRDAEVRVAFAQALDAVPSIAEDQILRAFANAILSTVRTSYYLPEEPNAVARPLALKIACETIIAMPEPRPRTEIFVNSPDMEGVHLRSGPIARGGIRWSSRPDDYRLEILGLMKAQRTKNALIVPVGAKGGFIIKRPRAGKGSSPASADDVRRQYEAYIGALLDVTDNVVDGAVVHPERVVVHDGEDPYLVVAADRGTATFSDIANGIAAARGFWLGDAFASGGSTGYDHKKEGITARGAWECVHRHFRERGRDPHKEPFTVAGIGDMGGDVFGNGMLRSRKILLVAAFNHLHIFLDPDPDPEISWEERRRLFAMPRSAWTDYETAKISAGGGVYPRDAKSIALSQRMRERLGVQDSALNGEQLVAAVLRMPVDLLWNGGIGTYVKASSETHHEVGDPANDAVRVNACDVHAQIVGEGGNLGFTQLARIEYALSGGRINTDFIDNSAGVDTSDHEVNLKILLAPDVRAGRLSLAERDAVLRNVTGNVCRQVLEHNSLQSLCLSLEERRGSAVLDDHRFLVDELVAAGLLDRAVEQLPEEGEFSRLRGSDSKLSRPQLAVLLAYAKIDAYRRILATDLPDGDDLAKFLTDYFPETIAREFPAEIQGHRLRREIAATEAVNAAINVMGITFFHRLERLQGESFAAILRGFLVAWELAEGDLFQHEVQRLYDARSPIDDLYLALIRFADGVERAVSGVLRRGAGKLPVAATIEGLRGVLSQLDPACEPGGAPAGLPEKCTQLLIRAERLADDLDLGEIVRESGGGVELVLAFWRGFGKRLEMERVEAEAARIACPTADDIQARASLLEDVRRLRRELTRRGVRPRDRRSGPIGEVDLPGILERLAPAEHPARLRVARMLEAARAREPLTLSNLFVIVDALERFAGR